MRKYIYLVFIVSFLSACQQTPNKNTTSNSKPIVTVSIEPQRYFAEAIARDKIDIKTLIPKGQSPETYDPTPRQLIELSQSKAFLRIGYIGFELSWMKRLQEGAPDVKVYNLSEGISFLEDTQHRHNVNYKEPHIWNSTINAIAIARNINKAFCELDSANAHFYQQNTDSLCAEIQKVDNEIRTLLEQNQHTNSFLIYHPTLSYFARDYKLNQLCIEQDGKEPTPAHLKELTDECLKKGIKVLFIQPEFNRSHAEVIAKETHTQIIPINPLSYNWKEEMLNIAKAFTSN